MATPLALKYASKNKNVDDMFLGSIYTRLTWQPESRSWKMETSQQKLFAYYFLIYGLFGTDKLLVFARYFIRQEYNNFMCAEFYGWLYVLF